MALTRLGSNNSTNISGINLTSQVTGTLPVANGGTNLTSGFVNGVLNTPVFRAHLSVGQNIDSNSATKVAFNAETFDPQGTFDSNKFTPAVTGKYLLNASLRMPSGTDYNQLGAIIYKNGAGAAYQWQNSDGTSGNPSAFVTTLIDEDATSDYFEVYLYHLAGSTKQLTSGLENTWFEGFLIST